MDILTYTAPDKFKNKSEVEDLMVWAYKTKASDITIQSNDRLALEIHGKFHFPLNRELTGEDVTFILETLTGRPDAVSVLGQGKIIDCAYAVTPKKGEVYRFRVNVTLMFDSGDSGASITCRTILSLPPKIDTLDVEKEIIDNMCPSQGMILVTGPTGSGKTTLLASMIRDILENPNSHKKIITYEDPVEYSYKNVRKPTCVLAQAEIKLNVEDFRLGAISAMRRKSNIILMGEMRDPETIKETLNLALSGHAVMSTLHSNGFVDTFRRMVGMFPENVQNEMMVSIISALRMTIGQQLLPRVGGGRVLIREIVVFNETIVKKLLDPKVGLERLPLVAKEVLDEYGKSFLKDAYLKYKYGLISKETLFLVARSTQVSEKEMIKMVNSIDNKNKPSNNLEQVQDEITKISDFKNNNVNVESKIRQNDKDIVDAIFSDVDF